MDIYGIMVSPYVARVVLTARHKGIKHKLLMPEGGLKSPAYLALNPLGKMPVVKDGKTVLFESAVIVDYLDAKSKKKRIVPTKAGDAARARLIAQVVSEYVQAPTLALLRQRDPANRDAKVVEEKLADVAKGLDAFEKLLSGKSWAAGTKFTIADVFTVPCIYFLETLLPHFGVSDVYGKRRKLKKYVAKLKKDKLTSTALNDMADSMAKLRAARG